SAGASPHGAASSAARNAAPQHGTPATRRVSQAAKAATQSAAGKPAAKRAAPKAASSRSRKPA
ncbi:polyhydroxyalkanoate depolymerase, partial [Burkholderia glumae]|nr:polyhydroxyalkanoate depolymerase [Burkholderia glumae]